MNLYDEARSTWTDVQQRQIDKGMEKYGRPLGEHPWTIHALIDHAVMENVDQMHYIAAVKRAFDVLDKEFTFQMEVAQKRNQTDRADAFGDALLLMRRASAWKEPLEI